MSVAAAVRLVMSDFQDGLDLKEIQVVMVRLARMEDLGQMPRKGRITVIKSGVLTAHLLQLDQEAVVAVKGRVDLLAHQEIMETMAATGRPARKGFQEGQAHEGHLDQKVVQVFLAW